MDAHDLSPRYRVSTADLPSGGPDHEVGQHHGAYTVTYLIEPDGAPHYTLGVHSPRPGTRVLTTVRPVPEGWTVCIIERGVPFLGDVREPRSFSEIVEARGCVVGVVVLRAARTLLLLTDQEVVAVTSSGVAWRSGRVGVDGFDVDPPTTDGWVVCRPHPQPEAGSVLVSLVDGRVVAPARPPA